MNKLGCHTLAAGVGGPCPLHGSVWGCVDGHRAPYQLFGRCYPRRGHQVVEVKQPLLSPGAAHQLTPVAGPRTPGAAAGVQKLPPHLPGQLVLLETGELPVYPEAQPGEAVIALTLGQRMDEGQHAVHRHVPGPCPTDGGSGPSGVGDGSLWEWRTIHAQCRFQGPRAAPPSG